MVDMDELDERFRDILLPTDRSHRKPFRLLDLPPELWLRIAELVVVRDEPIEVTSVSESSFQNKIVQQPALTRTCRLLRAEGLPMFYRKNVFQAKHLCGVACPRQWFVAIGHANLRMMTEFYFHATFQPAFWAKKFADMGIKVDVAVAPQAMTMAPSNFRRLDTLVIRFL